MGLHDTSRLPSSVAMSAGLNLLAEGKYVFAEDFQAALGRPLMSASIPERVGVPHWLNAIREVARRSKK